MDNVWLGRLLAGLIGSRARKRIRQTRKRAKPELVDRQTAQHLVNKPVATQ